VVKEFKHTSDLGVVDRLLASTTHEHRLTALFLFVELYKQAESLDRKRELADFYLDHTDGIDNWDLVDAEGDR
jgi:hypothetical protein